MRLLLTFARSYPWQSLVMLIALLVAGLVEGVSLTALLPLLTKALNDPETGGQEVDAGGSGSGLGQSVLDSIEFIGLSPTIELLLGVIVIGTIIKSGLLFVANKKIGYIVAQVTTDLRLLLLRAMLASRWEYYLNQRIGRLTNSMSNEAMRAANAYLYGATLASQAIQVAVYMFIASLVMWQAALFALVMGGLLYLMLSRLVRMARRAGKKQTKYTKSMISRLQDTLTSVKPLKAMGREGLIDSVLVSETKNINRALRREVLSSEVLGASQEVMFVIVLTLGIYITLVKWNLPASSVLMLGFLLARVLKRAGTVQRNYQKMAASEAAYWSIQSAIEDAQAEREDLPGTAEPSLARGIEFRQVVFAYAERRVLDKIDLWIPSGAFTSIVGPSGTGKTTIMDLLIGLLLPQGGDVLIDGVSMAQIDQRRWRRMIGYVPQENVLLHDSIYYNVSLADPDIGDAEVRTALLAAGIWDFVKALPDGMATIVGERGGKLSGGQRQRIMIARALVHRPRLLILDEATTALDPASEAAICETLRTLRGEHTILAISHQAALVNAADLAYRLQNGKVVLEKDNRARSGNAILGRVDSEY
jgi:ATP-binding cassette subfamily C protein